MPNRTAHVRAALRRQMLSGIALALVVALIIGGIGAMLVNQRRAAAERDAFAKADLQAGVAAQQMQRVLAAIDGLIDQALLCRRLRMEGQVEAAETVEAALNVAAERLDFGVLLVGLGDQDGWLRWANKPDRAPRYVGDGTPLPAMRGGARGLVVSDLLASQTPGRGTLRFFRAIREPANAGATDANATDASAAGEFAGFAMVSVNPLALSARLRRMWLGQNVVARVVRLQDGVVLADSVAGPEFSSEGATLSTQGLALLNASNAGHIRRQSVMTRRDSFMAFRVIEAVALGVLVNIDALRVRPKTLS